MGPVASTLALKWSGLVTETSQAVTRNLADPGTDVGSATELEERYAFGVHHTAIVFTIRSRLNTLFVTTAVVNLLINGVVFASAAPPATGVTQVFPIPPQDFDPGDDIEVQVVVPPGQDEGNVLALTVVVEFL